MCYLLMYTMNFVASNLWVIFNGMSKYFTCLPSQWRNADEPQGTNIENKEKMRRNVIWYEKGNSDREGSWKILIL